MRSASRLSIMLFSVSVFLLTSFGLAVFSYRMFGNLWFWLIFVYVAAWAVLFGFAVDLFGEGKLGSRRFFILTFGVMLASALFTHSVWAVTTPNWFFSVSTDRAMYRPGELVTITASLNNMGLISHSLRSASGNPVIISIEYQYNNNPTLRHQVYYSSLNRNVTGFDVRPGETLERSFIWNQTDIYTPGEEIGLGTYWINAIIPEEDSDPIWEEPHFSAWTRMNIISA